MCHPHASQNDRPSRAKPPNAGIFSNLDQDPHLLHPRKLFVCGESPWYGRAAWMDTDSYFHLINPDFSKSIVCSCWEAFPGSNCPPRAGTDVTGCHRDVGLPCLWGHLHRTCSAESLFSKERPHTRFPVCPRVCPCSFKCVCIRTRIHIPTETCTHEPGMRVGEDIASTAPTGEKTQFLQSSHGPRTFPSESVLGGRSDVSAFEGQASRLVTYPSQARASW